MSEFAFTPHNGAGKVVPVATYTGIAGAFPDQHGRHVWTQNGYASGGGILFPFSNVKFADITDGTSHTMIIGEQSNYLTQRGTTTRRIAIHSWPHGMFMGVAHCCDYRAGAGDGRKFNTATVRHPINYKWAEGGHNKHRCPSTGVCGNMGNNNPIQSAHSGGAHVGLADGSIRFLSASMNLNTLRWLATRDDGQPLPEF